MKKLEDVGIKYLNDPKAYIEYSPYIDDVYNNIDYYNPNKRRKKFIMFDDMIADIMTNKKIQTTIKKLFIRCRKLNIIFLFQKKLD